MSTSTRSNAKRKRKKSNIQAEESSSDGGVGGIIEHETISFQVGKRLLELEIGDSVLIQVPENSFGTERYGKSSTPSMLARVERIWEERIISTTTKKSDSFSSLFKFRARWFIQKPMIDELPSLEELSSRLTDRDLILSDQFDDNFVSTIREKILVIYRRPDSDGNLPSLPDNTFVCRYSVAFGANSRGSKVSSFEGEEDSWSEMRTLRRRLRAKRPRSRASTSDETSSSDSSIESDEESVEKCIRVGREHQAYVPKIPKSDTPSSQSNVVSRKPTLVWKAERITKEKLDSFVTKVSEILYLYLKENRLTQEEPYSPLSWDRMESVVKGNGSTTLPTLSTMCTVSSLCKSDGNTLREFDADSIMAILHRHDYDTDAALMTIRNSPQDFLTLWSLREKDMFNARFRKYAGSLRMIWKGISDSKGFQDIIDYHYRFKIPDQFRLFQSKKREQAVRVVETMEAKHTTKTIIPIIENGRSPYIGEEESKRIKGNQWNKTGISNVTGAVKERRSNAKELLLDIESELGQEKVTQVVAIITNFHQMSSSELEVELVDAFGDNGELKARFIEFLPRG